MSDGGVEIAELVASRVRDVLDFPEPGIVFKDITPLLADRDAFHAVVEAMAEVARAHGVTKVAGIEARGFILAAPVALAAHAGFVPVRKVGKLPGETRRTSYDLEYGAAEIEVQADAFTPGERVLLVDDVLATGGTAAAAIELVEALGASVEALAVLLELDALDGRSRLAGREVATLLHVPAT
ncbi:MAG: adenine phosphoribosyltransferase [Actinomycetes bacterium]